MSQRIAADHFLHLPVGYGVRASDKGSPPRPLIEVLEAVRSPDAALVRRIEQCRTIYLALERALGLLGFPDKLRRDDPDHSNARDLRARYGRAKAELPYFAVSGTWPGEDRRDGAQRTHTSLYISDLDHLSRADLDPAEVREKAAALPYVLCAFISPSGDGVKVVIVASPAPSPGDSDGHGHCWDQTHKKLAMDLGIPIDPDPQNRNALRLCYLSVDLDIDIATEVTPVEVDPKPKQKAKGKGQSKSKSSESGSKGQERGTGGKSRSDGGIDPRPTPEEWETACLGLGLMRTNTGLVGPCPACGGEDRFHVDLAPPHGWGCRQCKDGREPFAPYWAAFPDRRRTGRGQYQDMKGSSDGDDDSLPHPWIHPTDPWDPWRCTPDADCARMIRRHADKLLAVEDFDGRITLRVTRPSGTWSRAYADLDRLVVETQIEWAKLALDRVRDSRQVGNIAKWAAKTEAQRGREDALASAGRVIIEMRERGSVPDGLTQCMEWSLDARPEYLGMNNGVLNLGGEPGNELLTGMPARRCLVTRSTGVDYRPGARHDLVDSLTAHLDPETREHILDALAFGLWARPSRRIYFLCGDHNGGKSTLLAAARSSVGDTALGGYGMQIQGHALLRSRFQTPNDHAGGLFGVQDARIGTISEIPEGRESFNTQLIKQLVGGDGLNIRNVREKSTGSRPARATLFVAMNPPDMDRLNIIDPALKDRVCILPYPQIAEKLRDKRIVTQVQEDPAVREAMLAMLVGRCLGKTEPPVPPNSVVVAGLQRRAENMGPVGRWALMHLMVTHRRMDRLTTDGLIDALGQEFHPDASGLYDGLTRREVLALFRDVVAGMPSAKVMKVDGRNQRGYEGVRLATPEEVADWEAAEDPDEDEWEESDKAPNRSSRLRVMMICLDCGSCDLDETALDCPDCGCTQTSTIPWEEFSDRVRASSASMRARYQARHGALDDFEKSVGRQATPDEVAAIEQAFLEEWGFANCTSCGTLVGDLPEDVQDEILCDECNDT